MHRERSSSCLSNFLFEKEIIMSKLYEILPYSIDVVCACINDFTDTPISVIKRKPFLSYLDSYIKCLAKNLDNKNSKVSILLEKEYVDRFFLQDYSNYYVKCFNHYKRDCIRMHFFLYDEYGLERIFDFNSSDRRFIDFLQMHYLGFMVIRPMPNTFIARACLKKTHEKCLPILKKKKIKIHLLGLEFSVEAIPFIEQDHVLSVCATSALWSFFNAHINVNKSCVPSPFQITAMAMNTDMVNLSVVTDVNAQLNSGLTIDMMCNCIKTFGLVPQVYEVQPNSELFFYELIHVFVSSGFPVILGVAVYEKNSQEKGDIEKGDIEKGLHAVVVLGDEIGERKNFDYRSDDDKKYSLQTYAQYLSELYVHDDRIGPYASLKYEGSCWVLPYGTEVSKEKHIIEYYKSTDIVIGVYPKVRLPFSTVWNFAFYLNEELNNLVNSHKNIENMDDECSKEFISQIKWDFRLEDGSSVKSRIRSSNVIEECKSSFLEFSLPHYCWCIKAFLKDNIIFEVIIDSTELPQGKYVISVLYYYPLVKNIFKKLQEYFEAYIKESGGDAFTDLIQHDLWSLYKWFNPETDVFSQLDFLFGEVKIPRYFKTAEFKNDAVINQTPFIYTSKEDGEKHPLESLQKYIWVINKDGFLLIGKEEDCKGHPTLLSGGVGRIAGELHFDTDCRKWKVNSKSGRYSVRYTPEDAKRYVNNVITERLKVFFDATEFEFEEIPEIREE